MAAELSEPSEPSMSPAGYRDRVFRAFDDMYEPIMSKVCISTTRLLSSFRRCSHVTLIVVRRIDREP